MAQQSAGSLCCRPRDPFDLHHDALQKAFAPWSDEKGSPGNRLCNLKHEKATLASIADAVSSAAQSGAPFTHVHILAHGARLDEADPYSPIGVQLHGEVISGRRLATSLSSVTDQDGVGRPAVVTLATCESAEVADVRTPDASVAHDLHDQGIPLVVASQFPLSVEGSVPFVERFYAGQLRGEHPLVSLYDVRLLLHVRMIGEVHDWASLVVYEAFPSDLPEQLEELRYWQARRAQESALGRIESLGAQYAVEPAAPSAENDTGSRSTEHRYEEFLAGADEAGMRLPNRGPYALECAGLRAAGHKRLAEVAFRIAIRRSLPEAWHQGLFSQGLARLNAARAEYWRATKAFLGPSSEPMRRKANLHWLLGQVLSLDVVLGRPFNALAWTAARLAAQIDAENPSEDVRTWAYVSLSELALLRLADETTAAGERAKFSAEALENANRVVDQLGRSSEQVMTTSRQFERYTNLWGNPEFAHALERMGIPTRRHWHLENGLVPTAKLIVQVLRGPHEPAARSTVVGAGEVVPESTAASTVREAASARPEPSLARSSPSHRSKASRPAAVFDVEMLPAENGDSLWIEYGDPEHPHRIVIDCGAESATKILASRIKRMDIPLKLFVLTHIDADHINGALPLFADRSLDLRCEDIWFNGWRQVNQFLSVKQGEQFSDLLGDPERRLPWNLAMGSPGAKHPAPVVVLRDQPLPCIDLRDGMRLILLSPGADQLACLGRDWKKALLELKPQKVMLGRKPPPPPVMDFAAFELEPLAGAPARKDSSAANGSSIALLAEFDGRAVLLAGDAHADVLVNSIKQLQRERGQPDQKLKLDALKLSHHGSANATTIPLLELLDCQRYLVSTNGNIFSHPDREAMARVILHGGHQPTLYFNYRSPLNGLWAERILRERYGYNVEYPSEGDMGLLVRL
jgi:hypothetical protein